MVIDTKRRDGDERSKECTEEENQISEEEMD